LKESSKTRGEMRLGSAIDRIEVGGSKWRHERRAELGGLLDQWTWRL